MDDFASNDDNLIQQVRNHNVREEVIQHLHRVARIIDGYYLNTRSAQVVITGRDLDVVKDIQSPLHWIQVVIAEDKNFTDNNIRILTTRIYADWRVNPGTGEKTPIPGGVECPVRMELRYPEPKQMDSDFFTSGFDLQKEIERIAAEMPTSELIIDHSLGLHWLVIR